MPPPPRRRATVHKPSRCHASYTASPADVKRFWTDKFYASNLNLTSLVSSLASIGGLPVREELISQKNSFFPSAPSTHHPFHAGSVPCAPSWNSRILDSSLRIVSNFSAISSSPSLFPMRERALLPCVPVPLALILDSLPSPSPSPAPPMIRPRSSHPAPPCHSLLPELVPY